MRITAGQYKNRKILTPKGLNTRPTPSKVREAIFNICQSRVNNARFLDLFAGSGIISFEALSRGASASILIDSSREAKRCILQNIETFSLKDKAKFLYGDVIKTISKLADDHEFDIIYADPPYGKGLSKKILHLIDHSNLLSKEGILFIEEGTEIDTVGLENLKLDDIRSYGLTKIHRFTWK